MSLERVHPGALRRRVLLAAGLLLAFLPPGLAQQPPTTPEDVVREILRLAAQVREPSKLQPGSDAEKQSAQAAARITSLIPMERLARRTLGAAWSTLSDEQHAAYLGRLQRVLEGIAYPKAAEFFGDLQVSFDPPEVGAQTATVSTTVTHPTEGSIVVEYDLRLLDGRWLLDDVLLDEVSLVEHLRTQVQKVLAEHGFDELLKRMDQKLLEGVKAKFEE